MVMPDSLIIEKPASGKDDLGSKPERSSITMLREMSSSISDDRGCGAAMPGKDEPREAPTAETASPFKTSRRVIAIRSPLSKEFPPLGLSLEMGQKRRFYVRGRSLSSPK